MMAIPDNIFICPFCGHLTQMIRIHGHGQCAMCKMIIDECCRGEQEIKSEYEKENKDNKNASNDAKSRNEHEDQ